MKYLSVYALLALTLSSCMGHKSTLIKSVADLPIKKVEEPSSNWDQSPLRAHYQYIMYGANSDKERKQRLGDYYFVRWYDAQPNAPTELRMYYTQALTTSQVLTRNVTLPAPRRGRGTHQTPFFFSGADRAKRGDIMSWRIELWQDGQLRDAKQSYMW